MFMYGAGADPNYQPFLEQPIGDALRLVHRNCTTPLELCHALAGPMVARGKGCIVLVSSGAGFAGAPNMVAYGASKAFDTVMGEALWAELHDKGIDVLVTVLGATDTPALRRTLARRGMLPDPDAATPIPGATSPDEVVADVLANLTDGPTLLVGERTREGSKMLRGLSRGDAVRAMLAMSSGGVMETRSDETGTA
jgi:short-subunit dehydrogenase